MFVRIEVSPEGLNPLSEAPIRHYEISVTRLSSNLSPQLLGYRQGREREKVYIFGCQRTGN